jgi:hypothetical protein
MRLAGRSKLQCGVNIEIHGLVKRMKDKRSKSLVKPKGQISMITKTQEMHLVRVTDTPVILSCNKRTSDEHGNACVQEDLT